MGEADLRGADLGEAYLGGANLGGAYLGGADMGGADLDKITVNWMDHQLISEILFRAAGKNIKKRMVAGLVRISPDWCWNAFEKESFPFKSWAIVELKKWVKDNDNAPIILRS